MKGIQAMQEVCASRGSFALALLKNPFIAELGSKFLGYWTTTHPNVAEILGAHFKLFGSSGLTAARNNECTSIFQELFDTFVHCAENTTNSVLGAISKIARILLRILVTC